MRINVINNNPNYSFGIQHNANSKLKVANANNPYRANNINFIVFKGGNKDQALFYGVEVRPYFQKGGVSTIFDDMRNLKITESDRSFTSEEKSSQEYWNQQNKVFVSPVYNGKEVYNYETGTLSKICVDKIPNDLPSNHPLNKYKGKYFMTNSPVYRNYTDAKTFLTENSLTIDKQIFILEDVTGGKKTMDFASSKDTEIKLFRVMREFKDGLGKTRDFLVFSDVAATWKGPYEGGGYASGAGIVNQNWKGEGDARSAKAFTELFERICEVASEDGTKFCPGSVVLNDSQGAYAVENIAQKATKGGEFWKGIKPIFITHNAGAGYIQKTTPLNMFMNIADEELINAVRKDPEFISALEKGNDAINSYFAARMPKEMMDAQNAYSPFLNASYYARKGFVSMVTVSPGYHKALTTDPNLAPGAHETLNELAKKGDFVGILNAFENAGMDPFSKEGAEGYFGKKDSNDGIVYTFPEKAGTLKDKTIEAFSVMDTQKVNSKNIDMTHVKEIKRQNRAKLLERFDKDVIDALSNLKNVEGHEKDYNLLYAGSADKSVNVYGHIDENIIEKAKQADSNVRVITSWGRVDDQKGLDSVLASFEKYILKHPEDTHTVLVMGGALDLSKGNEEGKKAKSIIDRMNANPKLQGRFVYLDGFAPNKPLAAGSDFSMFPSRFAPCELTDLESYKLLCRPIVTNCQGLADKNFDPDIPEEKARATGYKTKHAYDMPLKELKKEISAIDKVNEAEINAKTKKSLSEGLNVDLKKFMDKIKLDSKIKRGKNLSDEEVFKMIREDSELHRIYEYKILRPYRDAVIENELTDCLERALIRDNGESIQDDMIRHIFNAQTDWENNAALNGGKSSGPAYRELFRKDGSEIKEEDTLLYKSKQLCKDVIERAKETAKEGQSNKPSTGASEAKGNKWLIIGASAVGLLGLGYGILSAVKNHKAKAAQAEQAAQIEEETAESEDEEEV